jgi:toxin ParE1/3/4
LIYQALADIAIDPDRPPAKRRPEILSGARTFHISRRGKPGRHFLLYRVIDREYIDVGRLLHDSMDLKQHLPGGFDPAP